MLAKEGVKAGLSSNDVEQPPFLQLLIMDDFSNSSGRNSSCLWIFVSKKPFGILMASVVLFRHNTTFTLL